MWSWTSSCRRTSSSPWWRDSALWTANNVPLCLTQTKCSHRHRSANPRQILKSTLAGNSGSFEQHIKAFLEKKSGHINTPVLLIMDGGIFRGSNQPMRTDHNSKPAHLEFWAETALQVSWETAKTKTKQKKHFKFCQTFFWHVCWRGSTNTCRI